jgi:peptide/nickel transport system permease protein
MLAFIIKRVSQTVVVLFLLSVLVFSLLHFLPGDPAIIVLGTEAEPEEIQALREELNLDKPLPVQYGIWLNKMFHGDFGASIMYDVPVTDLLVKRFPITISMGFLAILIACVLGTSAGVVCAIRRGTMIDQVITVIANAGISIPVFWLGILGIYAFGLTLGWLPVQGYTSPFDDFWLSVRKMIMPTVCLSVIPLAVMARQARSAMLEVIQQDYIRTAWSKGLKERVIVIRHALKNALIPVVTLIGLQVRYVVGGSVLIETVFNIPGTGRLLVTAIFDKDFLIVQSTVLVIGVVIGVANLLVDISYGYIDPRIRY